MMETKMIYSKLPIFIALFILLSLSPAPASAAKKTYIVYMGSHPHNGRKMTEAALNKVSDSHYKFLGSYLGSTKKAKDCIIYSYRGFINGFAAVLDEKEAAEIRKDPNVVSVFKNKARQLHTTTSWNFLSLENDNGFADSNSLWTKAKYGEDIIIGNLDNGVWPESESFSDKGYGPIPKKWKGGCQESIKGGVSCNNKLIGAKYFYKGYAKQKGIEYFSNFTARDDINGHGTHTLSTAGGNFVPGANVLGAANGTAKGGAPRARVAAYKVCWDGGDDGCWDADIIKGFDEAMRDGVDVLSVSLGDTKETMHDGIAIGSFHAVKHGIIVVASAGNEGPAPSTLENTMPWLLTVGASTMDRKLVANIDLGNGLRLEGSGVFKAGQERPYSIITGAQAKAANAPEKNATRCVEGALDPEKVKGKIVVCVRGGNDGVEKSSAANRAGAVGMILCNDKVSGHRIETDTHSIPSSNIDYTARLALFAYINSTKDPQATIRNTIKQLDTPAPVMADFSSRGPSKFFPAILKPDITAPGVGVLAAYGLPVPNFDKQTSFPFFFKSGTSMSCPHVSGIAALLKAIHRDWSPAAIRSAIMTTASPLDDTGSTILSDTVKGTPFDYGAGHVRPNLAADPGLVYDIKIKDYKKFLCAVSLTEKTKIEEYWRSRHSCPNFTDPLSVLNLNYPSITVPNLAGSVTVRRTLKNVGPPGTYKARIVLPKGYSATVTPDVLTFSKAGEEMKFSLTLKGEKKTKGYSFGELVWSDGVHNVRSPVVVATDAPKPMIPAPIPAAKE